MESELDPLGNGKPLEAWKEHEQICKLETQKWSSVSREVPYVQLISRICFLVKKCFNSAFQSVREYPQSLRGSQDHYRDLLSY